MAIDLAEQSISPHMDLLSTSLSDNSESALCCVYSCVSEKDSPSTYVDLKDKKSDLEEMLKCVRL